MESLSLIEMVDELNNKSSEEYDVLVEELEREKQDRKEDVKELQVILKLFLGKCGDFRD